MLTLTIPAEPSHVAVVRGVAAALLERLGADPEDIFPALVVLGELCANVVQHAYDDPAQTYTVRIEPVPGGARFVVTDRGRGLLRAAVPEPDPDRPCGRGIWMVEQFARH